MKTENKRRTLRIPEEDHEALTLKKRRWKAYITENVDMSVPILKSININGVSIPTYDAMLDEIRKLNREITKTRIISAVQTIVLALAVICISIKIAMQ